MNKGNKILLIAPTFFGYYKEIMQELKKMEYEVDYFCDSPSNTNLFKAISRISKKIVKAKTEKYFEKEMMPIIKNKKYDYVFFVIGMTFSFSTDIVEKIKKLNKDAFCVMYQWDGEKNIKFIKKFHKYFNKVYTFDRIDCENSKIYNFLPLFYTRNYEEVGKDKRDKFEYDASYIGTAHPQKYKIVNEMSKKLKYVLPKQYVYHYMPSKLKFFYHKLTSKEYKNVKLRDLKLEKMPAEEVMKIFKESRCIFDAPQDGQKGLTIRSIECLGAKRKLITNNQDIKNYDFYNESNIFVYSSNDIDENNHFFKEKYQEIPIEIYEKYSLRNWLKTILNKKGE